MAPSSYLGDGALEALNVGQLQRRAPPPSSSCACGGSGCGGGHSVACCEAAVARASGAVAVRLGALRVAPGRTSHFRLATFTSVAFHPRLRATSEMELLKHKMSAAY